MCNLVQIQQNTGVTGFLNSQLVTGFTPFYIVMLTHAQLKQGVCENTKKSTCFVITVLYVCKYLQLLFAHETVSCSLYEIYVNIVKRSY